MNGIHIGQATSYLKNHYPTVLEERRKIHFGNLEQVDEPVREFYRKLKHYGDLLHFGNEIVEHHFFKGLSIDNQLEVERIGADKSIEELVKSLERVEKRKSEMKLGLTKRTKSSTHREATPELISSSASYKPISGYSPEEVDNLIKNATEKVTRDFQAQIQELQTKIPVVPVEAPIISGESIKHYPVIPEFNKNESEQSIFQQAGNALRKQDKQIREDMIPSSNTEKMVSRITERIEQQRLDKEIEDLISKINNNFNIRENDAMDTSNLIREITTDDDEYTLQLVRKKK